MAAFSRGLGLCGLKASPFSISRAFLNSTSPIQRIQVIARPFSSNNALLQKQFKKSAEKWRLSNPSSKTSQAAQAATPRVPLKQYNARSEQEQVLSHGVGGEGARAFDALGISRKARDKLDELVARMMSEGGEHLLYEAPKRRWAMTTAILLVFATCGYLIYGTWWLAYTPTSRLEDIPLVTRWIYVTAALFLGGVMATAYMTRVGYVKRLTLVPRTIGQKSFFDVRVQARGWLPFQTSLTEVELEDVRTSIPLSMKNLPPHHSIGKKPLTAYWGIQQPFIWAGRRVQEVMREFVGTFVWFGRRKSTEGYMVALYTSPNRHFYNTYSLDVRGRHLGGPSGFSYFIEALEYKHFSGV